MDKKQTKDDPGLRWFAAFLGMLVFALLFTNANCVVFYWYFIPFVYPKDVGMFYFVTLDMVTSYFKWPIGKTIILFNIAFYFFAWLLWRYLIYRFAKENTAITESIPKKKKRKRYHEPTETNI